MDIHRVRSKRGVDGGDLRWPRLSFWPFEACQLVDDSLPAAVAGRVGRPRQAPSKRPAGLPSGTGTGSGS